MHVEPDLLSLATDLERLERSPPASPDRLGAMVSPGRSAPGSRDRRNAPGSPDTRRRKPAGSRLLVRGLQRLEAPWKPPPDHAAYYHYRALMRNEVKRDALRRSRMARQEQAMEQAINLN